MKLSYKCMLFATLIFPLSGCASLSEEGSRNSSPDKSSLQAPKSFLRGSDEESLEVVEATKLSAAKPARLGLNELGLPKRLTPLDWVEAGVTNSVPLRNELSNDKSIAVFAEKMPLIEFIHYVFGDLIGVNYVLGADVTSQSSNSENTVTLRVANLVSANDVFELSSQLLIERGLRVKASDTSYFIYSERSDEAAPEVVFSVGRDKSLVPETIKTIMQVIPIKFGIKGSIERTLRALVGAKVVPDFEQSAIFVEGSRAQVLRAMELIDLLDTPATRGKYIGLIDLTYMLPADFANETIALLGNEGIKASFRNANGMNLVFVPLEKLGAVVVFATNEFLLDRARYWASILDAPSKGDSKQYFVYRPKYSRAIDLSESVGMLTGSSTASEASITGQAPSAARSSAGVVDNIDMVIDERANSLIFYCTGLDYRGILPLLKTLDVMPKQVMLDIVIAEVSLKDEFKYGVEWALQEKEVILTTQGAFGAQNIGGMGLIINGAKGPLTANLLSSSSLVKVLSNPSLMVRDGTDANISIGSEISVVGQTAQDPINGERQTTTSEYRSTGVVVSVSVAVNGAGIVSLKISQSISNSVPGTSGAGGNPDIFTRDVNTEVIARSGQTVMLGGLISENKSLGGSGTPLLSKIPILGSLFKSESGGTDRTELVMLITPKVMDDLSSWEDLLEGFGESLRYVNMND